MNEGVYPGGICPAQFKKLGDMSELRGNVRSWPGDVFFLSVRVQKRPLYKYIIISMSIDTDFLYLQKPLTSFSV